MPHAKIAAKKQARVKPKRRTAAERRETRRILFSGRVGRPPKYKPDFHPDDIVAYFRVSLDAIEEPERIESPQGGVKHVQAPVSPPTLSGGGPAGR